MSPIIRSGYASQRNQQTRQNQHWQHVRLARLALDGYRCQLRYPGCTERANTVHLDSSLNGDHNQATIDNTLSACRHCHSKRGGL